MLLETLVAESLEVGWSPLLNEMRGWVSMSESQRHGGVFAAFFAEAEIGAATAFVVGTFWDLPCSQ